MRMNFIYKVILFVLILFVVDRSLGYYLDRKYEVNTCDYMNGRFNAFIKHENVDTLFIGSSRVLHMIVPELLGSKTKNLAFQKKHIYHNIILIDLLKEKKKLPKKLLVLNFDLDDLYLESENDLLNQLNSLSYYYHKNDLAKKLIDRNGYQEKIKFLSEPYRYNGDGWKLISYPITGNCVTYREDGYFPLLPSQKDSIRLAQSLIEQEDLYKFDKINQAVVGVLDYLVELCKNENIDLKIINGPYYDLPSEFIKAGKYMKNYCDKKGVYFVDFNDCQIQGLEDITLWYDNMHLNDNGAKIYTKHVKKHFLQTQPL